MLRESEYQKSFFQVDVAIFPRLFDTASAAKTRYEDLPLESFTSAALNGVLLDIPGATSVHFADSFPLNVSLADASHFTGEWFGVFFNRSEKSYVICSDYFGFANVYYGFAPASDGSKTLVIGSSFRAVCAALDLRGTRAHLNRAVALPSLTSPHSLLTHRHTYDTFREGVAVLAPNEALYICGSRYVVLERPFFSNVTSPDNYQTLLSAGIERSIRQIKNSVETNATQHTFGLSGGRDSRTVLSLLLAAGVEKEIGVISHNPSSITPGDTYDIIRNDLLISTRIVERLGLEYAPKIDRNSTRLSVYDHTQRFLHHRSHQSFELGMNTMLLEYINTIDFYGGGGEMFRGYFGVKHEKAYPKFARSLSDSTKKLDFRSQLAVLFDVLSNADGMTPTDYQRGKQVFIDSLAHGYVEGDSAKELLDRFYVLQRSRTHHSVLRSAMTVGTLTVSPLCQPEFFMANQCLSNEERSWGKLQFDIIETIEPLLNEVSLNNDRWNENLLAESRLEGSGWANYDGTAARKQWENTQNSKMSRSKVFGLSSFDHAKEFAKLLDVMGDQVAPAIGKEGIRAAATLSDHSFSQMRILCAKFGTLMDALGMSSTQWSEQTFSPDGPILSTITRSTASQPAFDHSFSQIRQEVSLGDINLHLVNKSGLLDIEMEQQLDGFEFAIYFFKNGVRISTIWYGEPILSVSCGEPGTYRAKVFIRRIGSTNAQRVIDSNNLVVS